jgi:hypothetical protein
MDNGGGSEEPPITTRLGAKVVIPFLAKIQDSIVEANVRFRFLTASSCARHSIWVTALPINRP